MKWATSQTYKMVIYLVMKGNFFVIINFFSSNLNTEPKVSQTLTISCFGYIYNQGTTTRTK